MILINQDTVINMERLETCDIYSQIVHLHGYCDKWVRELPWRFQHKENLLDL